MTANKVHIRGATTAFIVSAVWAVAGAATISVSACGKVTPGTDGGPAVTAAGACADVAKANCAKRVSCFDKINPTGTGILRVFGTMDECLTRETLMCGNALAAPDTGNSPALIEQCAAALSGESCADFFAENAPAACEPTGPRESGKPCAFDGQCATGFCSGTKNAACGTCAAPPAAGASCASSLCARDQLCNPDTLLCYTPGASGDPCATETPCGYGLSCPTSSGADASASHACVSAVADLGASCGGTKAACDPMQGLFCSGPAGAKTCVKIAYVGDGATCGALDSGGFTSCIAGGCYTASGLAGSGEQGKCKADVTDGAPCDIVLGPGCQLPARCVVTAGGNTGVCTEPTGASCS
jgi:hypothetical protein